MKNLGEHKVVVCPYFLHLFPGHNFAVWDWIKIIFGTNESKQDDVSQAKFRSLPSRSKANLEANSFPGHNFVCLW